jgi:hypothetical protein
MRSKWLFIVPAAIAGIAIVSAIGGGLVMLLWNWLMPPLFGRPEVTFWQAFGLLALCRILFGGAGGRGFHRAGWSAEEKRRFRERVRERLGLGAPDGESRAS